jgi:RNA polymerase sigma-70 factor (ECF subfamily)
MTEPIELTDDGLLRRVIDGDEEAFSLLYKRRHPSLYRFALHMSGNAAVAEDVTQEVFMALVRDPKRFDPAKGTLAGFLFGVARNHLRKRWEQDRRIVSLIGDPDELGPLASGNGNHSNGSRGAFTGTGTGNGNSNGNGNGHGGWSGNGNGNGHYAVPTSRDEFASIENVTRVRQAIGTLPENYREVVVLCELQEMSYEEAAAALDCPVGTVRSRLHRARAILVEKLRDTHRDTHGVRRATAVGE